MSNPPTDQERAVLDFLKGQENPFESLVRPQRLDENFCELHVPELLEAERQTVFDVIDRFRVEEYRRASDLSPSRVVFVLGDRGAGKTHLLRSLHFEERGKSHLLVQPDFYQKDLNIEEYLLAQIVMAFLEEDDVFHGRPIEDLAAALTRQLLRQALLCLNPTERIFVTSPRRWKRWRLLWGGGNPYHQRVEELARLLKGPQSTQNLQELMSRHGFSPAASFRLVSGHLKRLEKGRELLPSLRRHLYLAMARLTLLHECDSLERFLTGEYQQADGGTSPRFELTSRMLHALLEVCALVRLPVVFAFDNLERFFSPQGQFDAEMTRAFFNNLAQAVDYTRGILFLIFAENGLFQTRIAPNIDEFARVRLDQGVPLPEKGPLHEIHLRNPTAQALRALIHGRMKRWLRDAPIQGELPEAFPFSAQILDREISTQENQVSLRNLLRRLRDLYSQIVYGTGKHQGPTTTTPPAPPAPPAPSALEPLWQQHCSSAEQRLQGSLVPHLKELHAGLGAILQHALPVTAHGWTLKEIRPIVEVGENVNYGIATLLEWGTDTANGHANPLRIGVGLLLATGMGMAKDLKSKLDVFGSRALKVDRLMILWYTDRDAEGLIDSLPAKTREVWDGNRHRQRTDLRLLERQDLWKIAAILSWINAVQDQMEQPLAADRLREFVSSHCQGIFELVAPATAQVEERSPVDED